jgi:hypothetical protein
VRGGRLDLRARFFEGVGDRVLEAECAAFANGGIPGLRSIARAGDLEKRSVQPGVDRVLRFAVPVCGSGADEYCGALGVAVDYGDAGKATEGFECDGSCSEFVAEGELLAERGLERRRCRRLVERPARGCPAGSSN